MLSRLQRWTFRFSIGILTAVILIAPTRAVAQDDHPSSLAASVVKGVILDPTTYAPAVIAYDATVRDWNSSQPFFRHGYMEFNERFTITGLPNSTPVSYDVGSRRIVSDAFGNLGMSIVNNAADRIFEHALLDRFPTHRRVVRTLGWVERSAFGSYMSYRLSIDHYRQAVRNERVAGQLGYR